MVSASAKVTLTWSLSRTSSALGALARVKNQSSSPKGALSAAMGRLRRVPSGATVVSMATRVPFTSLRSFFASPPPAALSSPLPFAIRGLSFRRALASLARPPIVF